MLPGPDTRRPVRAGPAGRRLLVATLTAAATATTAACGSGSAPVSIGPGPGGADGCVFESGTEVCATGTPSGPAPSVPVTSAPATSAPAVPPTGRTATGTPGRSASGGASAWGGGRRVGSFRTTGTVVGVQAASTGARRLTGTCDVARDVRTVTAKVDPATTLTIAVTGPNVAAISLRIRGGTAWQVEYVGPSARDVVTLTPSRTRVAAATMVRVSGPAAAPVTIDADFDC